MAKNLLQLRESIVLSKTRLICLEEEIEIKIECANKINGEIVKMKRKLKEMEITS